MFPSAKPDPEISVRGARLVLTYPTSTPTPPIEGFLLNDTGGFFLNDTGGYFTIETEE